MTKDEIRLECLKLWHRHDRLPADTILNAKAYEEYIFGAQEAASVSGEGSEIKRSPGRPRKPAGNPNPFS